MTIKKFGLKIFDLNIYSLQLQEKPVRRLFAVPGEQQQPNEIRVQARVGGGGGGGVRQDVFMSHIPL